VDGNDGKVPDAQGIHLVFHQGDEGRYDQRDPGEDQGRKLIAERFSPSGGHNHQGIFSGEDGFEDLFLTGAKIAKPE
jgi:hypothetical protein